MACRVINVKAANGAESKLYKDLVDKLGDQGEALKLYIDAVSKVSNNSVDSYIQKLIENGEITYTNDELNPCAKMGLTNATTGTNWKIVKDFKGMPKHTQGGVDITISDKGVSMNRAGSKNNIKAKHGLLISSK